MEEAAVRNLLEDWTDAVRAKDIDGSLRRFAPDVVAFDLIAPLQYNGVDEVRQRLEDWFSSFDAPIGYELRELTIIAGEDVAYAHSLNP